MWNLALWLAALCTLSCAAAPTQVTVEPSVEQEPLDLVRAAPDAGRPVSSPDTSELEPAQAPPRSGPDCPELANRPPYRADVFRTEEALATNPCMDDISMELTDVVVDRAVVGGLFSGRFVVRNTGPEFVIPLEVTSPVWDLTIHDMNETLIFSRRGGWGPITRDGAELTFDWSSSRNNNGDPNQPIIVTRIDRFRITIVISYPGLERERDRYQMFFESEPPSPQ